MKLMFLSDYLGRETAMKQYRNGDVADFSTAQALELIRLEVAEEVEIVDTRDFSDPKLLQHTPKRKKTKDGDE